MAKKSFRAADWAECVKTLSKQLEGFMNAGAVDGMVSCDSADLGASRKAARDLIEYMGEEDATDRDEPAPNEGEARVVSDGKPRRRAISTSNPLSHAYGLASIPTKPGAARPAVDSIFGGEESSSTGTTLGDIFKS